ncbi:MAG: preprotein translocase subunit SecE [Paracoccus sp. (in: a-proteobacteria)]|uniref:preprotein translocase subunit SecE n=1 Tax=Paracoccus sp. TaxID=267 RepID=UPI0039E21E8A
MANPVQFISQVRAELGKIAWPTRREVITTTIMVFVMAALASIIFFLVDLAIKSGLAGLLGLIGS